MASLKVEVISSEIVKPSSPTPPHLRTIQLSFIDQFVPPAQMPFIFFYRGDEDGAKSHPNKLERSKTLKKTLSDTLALFYPLAGRFRGKSLIHCNDEGVEFREADVAVGVLSEVVERPPGLDELRKLLPFDPATCDDSVVLGVQVNHFSCGGVAIGLCASHKIVDANSYVSFVNAWATMNCKETERSRGHAGNSHDCLVLAQPRFDVASYFPNQDLRGIYLLEEDMMCIEEKNAAKRLVFDKKTLDRLKALASGGVGARTNGGGPTRSEVVIAFVWKRVIEAFRRANIRSPMLTMVVVNLRPRVEPRIFDNSFGNIICPTFSLRAIQGQAELAELAREVREATRKVDGDFVKALIDGDCLVEWRKHTPDLPPPQTPHRPLLFTSLIGFPFYEADFGWGRPTWVCVHAVPLKNLVMLMPTKCGEGIEAWVIMSRDDMDIIDRSPHLLSVPPNLFMAKL